MSERHARILGAFAVLSLAGATIGMAALFTLFRPGNLSPEQTEALNAFIQDPFAAIVPPVLSPIGLSILSVVALTVLYATYKQHTGWTDE